MYASRFRLVHLALLLSVVHHVAFALPPAGNTCQNGLMPALVRPTLPAVQTSLAMKQFLPIPLDTASAVSLFPGFNTVSVILISLCHVISLLVFRFSLTPAKVTVKDTLCDLSSRDRFCISVVFLPYLSACLFKLLLLLQKDTMRSF